jgi:uncharacterized membrane protein YccF (DUF307 family)
VRVDDRERAALTLILNILWLVCGGLVMALGWLVAAALMAVTIVFLPWSPAALRIAGYSLLPFGQEVVARDDGAISLLGNIVWFVLAGWWLCLGHLVLALGCAITIIGLPFAWAHLKLAGLSLAPVGKAIIAIP